MNLSSRPNIIVSVVIVALVFSAVGGYIFLTNQYVPPQIGVVVLEPGFGDRSMADQVLEGLDELAGDAVVNYTYRVADDADDAQFLLSQMASAGRFDLIIAIGDALTDRLQTVAGTYANQRFACIGGAINADNVVSATFAQHQAAFLAGALAAFMADNRSGIVGILASRNDDPTVTGLIAGFTQGLEEANSTFGLNIGLLPTEYVGSYNDTDEAYDLALDMWDPLDGNATIIFAPVRASIIGVRSAMEYANSTWFGTMDDREPFVIAAEGNQDYLGLEDIDIRTGDDSWVVTSVVPRTDLAAYRIVNSTLWDEFEGGEIYRYNLTDGNVNITDFEFSSSWLTPFIEAQLEDYIDDILNGVIVVDDGLP
jgi:basic membrane protein A